ncbi:hypothetical protein BKA65DRAFT_557238 [Rhexocercosporidium sp. MPI-PUGE-AT-0058]|nr:hypothetical protein BKA65DRAFT_557238 [Rhexocercosporidium sp. MPI-PUGE-AT-0058]
MRTSLLLLCVLAANAACLCTEGYHPRQENSVSSGLERRDLGGTIKTTHTPKVSKRYVMSGGKQEVGKREWNGKQNWDFKSGPLFIVIVVFAGLFAAEVAIIILYFTIKKLKPYWYRFRDWRERKREEAEG